MCVQWGGPRQHDLAAARQNPLRMLRSFCDAMSVLADPGYQAQVTASTFR